MVESNTFKKTNQQMSCVRTRNQKRKLSQLTDTIVSVSKQKVKPVVSASVSFSTPETETETTFSAVATQYQYESLNAKIENVHIGEFDYLGFRTAMLTLIETNRLIVTVHESIASDPTTATRCKFRLLRLKSVNSATNLVKMNLQLVSKTPILYFKTLKIWHRMLEECHEAVSMSSLEAAKCSSKNIANTINVTENVKSLYDLLIVWFPKMVKRATDKHRALPEFNDMRQVWQEMVAKCGNKGVRPEAYLHFTYTWMN